VFKNSEELRGYILENFAEVTNHRVNESHWDLECTTCKVTRGFQLTRRAVSGETVGYGNFHRDFNTPVTYIFRCPVCKTFKHWIVYEFNISTEDGKPQQHYFRVTSVPSEGLEDISELPQDPPQLRTAYRQAIRAMDANANIAAAAMFRRALQVITRELLGAKPGNLAKELNEVVGVSFNGVTITNNFAENGYIIKEIGNQAAHPDEDPDLLDFTAEDADDLQLVFMELVSELFIIPAAIQRSKQEFLARRKVTPKSATGSAAP
jgi:uncharacterized protein DUF4145